MEGMKLKIKIKSGIHVVNPPPIGSVHEVVREMLKPPVYFIKYNGVEVGVFPKECEIISLKD